MYEGKTVGVVIPVHNESAFVGEVIATVPSFVDRVYVVDDGSTDGSWAVIARHADLTIGGPDDEPPAEGAPASVDLLADGGAGSGDRVVATRHDANRGRGGAVKTGYRLAMGDGIDVVAVIDGDGQMDPDILDRIVDPVARGEADYAKGNRLASPSHWGDMSAWRLFGNALLTGLTKVASGYWWMRDPQNGYTAISAGALEQLDLASVYEDYGFLNDMLVRLDVYGMRVVDVPMRAVYGEESSGIRYSSFVPNLSALLVRRFVWRLWVKHVRPASDSRRTVPALAALPNVNDAATLASFGRTGLETVAGVGIPRMLAAVCLLAWTLALSIRGRKRPGADGCVPESDGERKGEPPDAEPTSRDPTVEDRDRDGPGTPPDRGRTDRRTLPPDRSAGHEPGGTTDRGPGGRRT